MPKQRTYEAAALLVATRRHGKQIGGRRPQPPPVDVKHWREEAEMRHMEAEQALFFQGTLKNPKKP